ncbi:MAG: signal recognition particle protein [Alphaproteobacteria bacterium]|jgi:signal recognition particle subunit SRP54|nr:signal recognition particle protein [Alphaproteobacteria bacterium]
MFEGLTKKINSAFDKLSFKKHITEDDVNTAVREIRIALLEADVSLPVIKDFIGAIKEKAVGEKIIKSVSPAEQIIKITNDELTKLLGETSEGLSISGSTKNSHGIHTILMLGLQGSGKTTSAGKLAKHLQEKEGKKVMVLSTDIYRPAAKEQLQILAEKIGCEHLPIIKDEQPLATVKRGVSEAKNAGVDVLIIDTAGRTHLDEDLMKEIIEIERLANPDEALLCVDAMIGQESVNIAKAFNDKVGISGIVMTRIDGDARGGAALSMRHETGAPIKFMGVGEKLEDFEAFYPDRMASRILGMGDVVSLVEKAQEKIDEKDATRLMDRMFSGQFDFTDMLSQINQMKKMGNIKGIMKFIPGASKLQDMMNNANVDDNAIKRQEAIILSMTPKERKNPDLILMARKKRIAKGAGVSVSDVDKLLKQLDKTRGMMKQMQSMGGLEGMMSMMKDLKKNGDL